MPSRIEICQNTIENMLSDYHDGLEYDQKPLDHLQEKAVEAKFWSLALRIQYSTASIEEFNIALSQAREAAYDALQAQAKYNRDHFKLSFVRVK